MRKYFEFYSGVKIKCGESALATIGTELAALIVEADERLCFHVVNL